MQEINIYDLLKHYAKFWLLILLCTLVGLGSGVLYNTYVQKPLYKSNATLLVLNAESEIPADKTTIINNYLELMKSRRVLEPVITSLKLDTSYEKLVGSVTTSNEKDTEVVKLAISTASPQRSKKLVDATVASFKGEIYRLYDTDTIRVIDGANLPTTPYNVRKNIQLALGTTAGFLFAVITVFFIYDYRLSSGVKPKTVAPKVKQTAKPSKKVAATKTTKPKKSAAKKTVKK